MSTKMKASKLMPNRCWAVTMGDSLVTLYDKYNEAIGTLFQTRADLDTALAQCNLQRLPSNEITTR